MPLKINEKWDCVYTEIKPLGKYLKKLNQRIIFLIKMLKFQLLTDLQMAGVLLDVFQVDKTERICI